MKILVSAGEVSGDVAGARVAAEIITGGGEVFGIGGSRMQAAGVRLLADATHLGTVGVTESFRAVPAMMSPARELRRMAIESPPDAALLIGNDIFNVLLGRWCKARGVPTVSFFPPQVWIWGSLSWLFSRSFDVVAASFPEEVEAYARHTRTEYVGHYLADVLAPQTAERRLASRAAFGLSATSRVVTVLPGSRCQEIRSLGRLLLGAVRRLVAERSDVEVLLAVSDPMFEGEIASRVAEAGLGECVRIVSDSHLAMGASDLVLTASGTATLEATLIGVPMVVVYRVSRLTHAVVKAAIVAGLMKGETVALPNLVLGRHVVPELTQSCATVDAVAHEAGKLLDDEEQRSRTRSELLRARDLISRPGTIEHVANLVRRAAGWRSEPSRTGSVVQAVGAPQTTRGRT